MKEDTSAEYILIQRNFSYYENDIYNKGNLYIYLIMSIIILMFFIIDYDEEDVEEGVSSGYANLK